MYLLILFNLVVLNFSIVKSDLQFLEQELDRFLMELEDDLSSEDSCQCSDDSIGLNFDSNDEIILEKYLNEVVSGKNFQKINKVLEIF
jgi:hypothetical protein